MYRSLSRAKEEMSAGRWGRPTERKRGRGGWAKADDVVGLRHPTPSVAARHWRVTSLILAQDQRTNFSDCNVGRSASYRDDVRTLQIVTWDAAPSLRGADDRVAL